MVSSEAPIASFIANFCSFARIPASETALFRKKQKTVLHFSLDFLISGTSCLAQHCQTELCPTSSRWLSKAVAVWNHSPPPWHLSATWCRLPAPPVTLPHCAQHPPLDTHMSVSFLFPSPTSRQRHKVALLRRLISSQSESMRLEGSHHCLGLPTQGGVFKPRGLPEFQSHASVLTHSLEGWVGWYKCYCGRRQARVPTDWFSLKLLLVSV